MKEIFSESEATDILRRAAQLQEGSGADGYASGITRAELERIANEAGIDPKHLLAAIERPKEGQKGVLSLIRTFDRVVPGEIPSDDLGDAIDAVRDRVRCMGVSQIGRSIETQASKWPYFGNVRISSKNGRTRLSVRSTPFMAYFTGLHAPLILSSVVTPLAFANGKPELGALALLGLLGGGVTAFLKILSSAHKRAEKLADSIEEELVQIAKPAEPVVTQAEEASPLHQRLGAPNDGTCSSE